MSDFRLQSYNIKKLKARKKLNANFLSNFELIIN